MRMIQIAPAWIISAMLLAATLTATQAQAATEADFQANTTGQLVTLCSADPAAAMGTAALNFCHGFIVGGVRVQQIQQQASRRQRLFCLPEPPPNRDQTIAEFVTWAKADPARLAMKPFDSMFAYLGGRFPCKSGQ